MLGVLQWVQLLLMLSLQVCNRLLMIFFVRLLIDCRSCLLRVRHAENALNLIQIFLRSRLGLRGVDTGAEHRLEEVHHVVHSVLVHLPATEIFHHLFHTLHTVVLQHLLERFW